MKEPTDYQQSYHKHYEELKLKRPLQAIDKLAGICAYLILLTGILTFTIILFQILSNNTATGTDNTAAILKISFYLIFSILIYALTQMIRAIFKKLVWKQDKN